MALPTIKTFRITEETFCLFWEANPKSNIKSWNLYGSSQVIVDFIPPNKGVVLPGGFVKIDSVLNRDTPNTPGNAYIEIPRTKLGIGPYEPYHFLITSIDRNNIESAMEVSNIHYAPLYDDHYVDEAGFPVNVIYRNFEFDLWPLSMWDADRYLDITSLLGRPARQVIIDSVGADIWVKFDSLAHDPISIRYSSPHVFELRRGELKVHKIYVHNPTSNDATVRIFVAG